MDEQQKEEWAIKSKLFMEYLRNGGIEKIHFPILLEGIEKIRLDKDGVIIPESTTSPVRAMMNLELHANVISPYYSETVLSEYQSILQKSLFFEQVNIDTEEDFDAIFEKSKALKNRLFRGQREARWRLYGSLQRYWLFDKLYEAESSYQELLERMVENGRNDHGDDIRALLKEHNSDSENDAAVLGYLQHHGCPTPLLDWSFNFSVALYFALDGLEENPGSKEIDDYFSLYHIDEEDFKEGNLKRFIDEQLTRIGQEDLDRLIGLIAKDDKQREEMREHFKGRNLIDRSRVNGAGLINHMTLIKHLMNLGLLYFSDRDEIEGLFFSLDNSKNILHQEGAFTWNPSPFKPLEQLGNEQYVEDTGDENYRFCECYNINKKLAAHVRKRIEEEGINKEYIYPDATDVAWGVFEKSKSGTNV